MTSADLTKRLHGNLADGVDMPWTRLLAIAVSVFGSTFLSRISQGMEFALMAYWIAVWVFF